MIRRVYWIFKTNTSNKYKKREKNITNLYIHMLKIPNDGKLQVEEVKILGLPFYV